MKTKQKGSSAEREIIRKFWDTGEWASMRAAGSGSARHPCPDIIASNGERTLVIECKSVGGDAIRVEREQLEQLQHFAKIFGAEVWVGARYSKISTKDSHGDTARQGARGLRPGHVRPHRRALQPHEPPHELS